MARAVLKTGESVYARAVRAAHAAAQTPKLWPEALAATADYIGATGGMFVSNDMVGGESWLIGARLDEHLSRVYLERHIDNLTVRAAVSRGPGIYATHAIVDLHKLRTSPLGVEVLAPLGIKSMFQVVHAPMTTKDMAGGLGFTLDTRQLDDEATVGRRLRRIAPQLRLAVDGHLAGARHTRAANAQRRQLALLADAAVITDASGRLLAANAAADALLDAGDVLRHDRIDRLAFDTDRDSRRLREALAVAALQGQGNAFALTVTGGWLAIVTPHADPGDDVATTPGRALLRLIKIDADHRRQAETAQSIFALTARETAVLAEIAAGRSIGEAAARLRVSSETVRTHVKGLYGKTGVNSQARLAQLIARFPVRH